MWICALVTPKLPSQHRESIEKSPPGQDVSWLYHKHVLCPRYRGAGEHSGVLGQWTSQCLLFLAPVSSFHCAAQSVLLQAGNVGCASAFAAFLLQGNCAVYTQKSSPQRWLETRNLMLDDIFTVTERMCKRKSSSVQFGLFRNYLKRC